MGYRILLLGVLCVLMLAGCQRSGYEMFRQAAYQECLKQSAHPQEKCQNYPDFDQYQRQRRDRYGD